MDSWYSLITLWLLCTVKFAVSFPSAILALKLNFFEALLFGMSSGVFGSFFFIYAGDWFLDRMAAIIPKRKNPKKKKVFTKGRRRLVYIKKKYGLIGLSIISPVFISIPVGCMLATRFYHNKKQILLHMSAAVFVWILLIYPFISMFRYLL